MPENRNQLNAPANSAAQESQSHGIHARGDPPRKKGGQARKARPPKQRASEDCRDRDQTQAQSRNGTEPPGQARIVKLGDQRKGHARVSNETANDERLGGLALGILTYALSKPGDWKLYSWHLAKRFHCGEYAIRTAMSQLRETDRVRPVYERAKGRIIAQYWQVRESAELPWPRVGNYLNVINTDKKITKQTKPSATKRVENKEKVRAHFVQKAQMSTYPFCPRVPYPKSEQEMREMLEARSIDYDPDHDGGFFDEMESRNWTLPNGDPVYDWPELYKRRQKKIDNDMI